MLYGPTTQVTQLQRTTYNISTTNIRDGIARYVGTKKKKGKYQYAEESSKDHERPR